MACGRGGGELLTKRDKVAVKQDEISREPLYDILLTANNILIVLLNNLIGK